MWESYKSTSNIVLLVCCICFNIMSNTENKGLNTIGRRWWSDVSGNLSRHLDLTLRGGEWTTTMKRRDVGAVVLLLSPASAFLQPMPFYDTLTLSNSLSLSSMQLYASSGSSVIPDYPVMNW